MTRTTRLLRWDGSGPHADDLAAVVRLHRDSELALVGAVDTSAASAQRYLSMPNTDRDESVLVEDDGHTVALSHVFVERASKDVFLDVVVDPLVPDATEMCLDRAMASARRIAEADGGSGWTARVTIWDTDEVKPPLLERLGLVPVRRFYRMHIDTDSPLIPAEAPPIPDGVELQVGDDDEARRVFWEVDNEAFLDHWNFTPSEYDEWSGFFPRDGKNDPDGWWMLRVDGEPAGFAILDDSMAEAGLGYVNVLGVRRAFRGRGLATLLLQRAFVRYRDLGRTGVELGVDAESLTGAVDLYERVGMRPVRVMQGWALELG